MDTFTIARILHGIIKKNRKRRAHIGCIPCNGLDQIKVTRYPFAFCVNDSPSPSPGNHWTGLYIENRNKPAEFFCSYGKPISMYSPHFKKFLKRNKLKLVESNICLQSLTSGVCGQHVIFYLYNRLKGCSRKAFYAKFSNDVMKNDEIVRKFVNKLR